MPENKTKATGASVESYIASRGNAQQRADCRQLMALLKKVTRHSPKMWGPSIVGYGSYRYAYESGRTGEAPLAGFAIRGRDLVVYVSADGPKQRSLLSKVGKHSMGKSCLYFKQLADLDGATLEKLVLGSLAEVRQRHGEGDAQSSGAADTPEAQLRSLIEKFSPKDQKLIRSVRSAVRKRLPSAHELAYDYNTFFVIAYSPTEQPPDAILATAARPDGVRLYLMPGPQLPDPKKLLLGSGKQARYVPLETARRLTHPDIEALIAAAIEHATVPLAAKGRGRLIIRTFGPKKRPRRKSAK